MKGIDTILEHLFREARRLDSPAQPRRGRTAAHIDRRYATRSPWKAKTQDERRRIRKAAHEARRRNRSAK